jgi:hypothetical protein
MWRKDMATKELIIKQEHKCPYCGRDPGHFFYGPGHKIKKNKTWCSRQCSHAHSKGYVYSEVIKSKIPEDVLLDPEDRERALDYVNDNLTRRWRYHCKGTGYVRTIVDLKDVFLHRFVLGVGYDNSTNVVFLNGNKKDCRKANLQIMTQEEHNIWHNTKITQDVIIEGVHKKKMSFETKHGAREVFFDPDDWDIIKIYRWCIKHSSKWSDYAQAQVPHPDGGKKICNSKHTTATGEEIEYLYSTAKTTKLAMHRLVSGLVMVGSETGLHIDHIDGNGLNNCKENLRITSARGNTHNRKTYSNGDVPYSGVTLRSDCVRLIKQGEDVSHIKNPFIARIGGGKDRKHLGCFPTAERAAEVYDKAVCKYWELVNPERQLNFPELKEQYLAEIEAEEKILTS